jgi:hypothetical protein
MLKLLLTFDYELFFNDTDYSEDEVLIKPTYSISEVIEKLDVVGNFFIDTPSIICYKNNDSYKYPQMVKEQVDDLLNHNNDVQLHIHPIWYNAEIINNQWKFDNKYYSLGSYSNVEEIITNSKQELDELAGGHRNYNCCAFRAGGFCYSPVSTLSKALYKNGIRIDSSICKNIYMNTEAQQFDYRNITSEENWSFSIHNDSFTLCDRIDESLFEVPIGTFSKVPHKWYLTHGMPKLNYPIEKGKKTPIIELEKRNLILKTIDRMKKSFDMPVLLTLDTLHYKALYEIVKFYNEKAKKIVGKDIYICAIGHPKFASAESIKNMETFIELVKSSMQDVEFLSFQNVLEREIGDD